MKSELIKKVRFLSIIILLMLLMLLMINTFFINNSYANDEDYTNTTIAYFESEIVERSGQGDCILLENYDAEGNKHYALVDTGTSEETGDSEHPSTATKDFIDSHGVTTFDFVLLTHVHGDHMGDINTILDNYTVNKIYIKHFDEHFIDNSDSTEESFDNFRYIELIRRAVELRIPIYGPSFESTISTELSPGLTKTEYAYFVNYMNSNNTEEVRNLFHPFSDGTITTENNIEFDFGSSHIKLFNWEIYDVNGDRWTEESTTQREIVKDDNNNSVCFLLTQGNSKGFFTGDLNNKDADENAHIGDEDRMKNNVGKVDFLKAAHHGVYGSNSFTTANETGFLNVLSPDHVMITNKREVGSYYKTFVSWLEDRNIDYLFVTDDEFETSCVFTSDEVYMGYGTTNTVHYLNGELYCVPDSSKYKDHTDLDNLYSIEYVDGDAINVDSYEGLVTAINDNQLVVNDVDAENQTANVTRNPINLRNSASWDAISTIKVGIEKNIVITSDEDVTVFRNNGLLASTPIFEVKGFLTIGENDMTGSICFNGNYDASQNSYSSSPLINVLKKATFNMNGSVTLTNNYNKITDITEDSSITKGYCANGSAIYATDEAKVNINGATIEGNYSEINTSVILPSDITTFYQLDARGAGVYIEKNTVLNMVNVNVNNNIIYNNSKVETASVGSNTSVERGLYQRANGAGVCVINSTANIIGGSISSNTANNNAITNIKNGTPGATNIYSLNNNINGVGIYAEGTTDLPSQVSISGNTRISNNTANEATKVTVENNAKVKKTMTLGIKGVNACFNACDIDLNGIEASNCNYTVHNGSDNRNIKGTVGSLAEYVNGGGLFVSDCNEFKLDNLTITNNKILNNGAGIYFGNSNGYLDNSLINGNNCNNASTVGNGAGLFFENNNTVSLDNCSICNNTTLKGQGGAILTNHTTNNLTFNECLIDTNSSESNGGGIYSNAGTISLINSQISNNTAQSNGGGGLFITANTTVNRFENVKVLNNTAKSANGGGIYTRADISIEGNDSAISGNKSEVNGGGIFIHSNSKVTLKAGVISNNETKWNGGGIYISQPTCSFEMTGGIIEGNNVTDGRGGGIGNGDYQATDIGEWILTGGLIRNNTCSANYGKNVYPEIFENNIQMIQYDGTWYVININSREVFDAFTGLIKESGVWHYYKNGNFDNTFTGLVEKDGTLFYIQEGILHWGVDGLKKCDGTWYYLKNSMVDKSFTGLFKKDGTWYYIQKGQLNWGVTTLVKKDGTWFYVKNSMVDWSFTGLVKKDGTWYYVQKGILNWGVTTLVKKDGTWFYVNNSMVDWSFTGLVKKDGTWYYIQKGQLNWGVTTLVKKDGTWFYVKNSMVDWSYTGLVYKDGTLYYVQKGILHWGYNGTATYNGKKYTVKNSMAV